MTSEIVESFLNTEHKSSAEGAVVQRAVALWRATFANPLWYEIMEEDLRLLVFASGLDRRTKWLRRQMMNTIGDALAQGEIPLAGESDNLNFDRERQPVDTLVIHHTESDPNMTPGDINKWGFIYHYLPDFLDGQVLGESVSGKPVGSGHWQEGKQVFYTYHWFVGPDGQIKKLLDDKDIAWHAGDWEMNKRSVGIVLAGNFDQVTPPEEQIKGLRGLISSQYAGIDINRILGHCEVNSKKTCPGATYINGWKETVVGLK